MKVPTELEHVVSRPGRDWTEDERRQIQKWLFGRDALNYLVRWAIVHIGRFFRAANASDAEDAWSKFFTDRRLDGVMRHYNPARGSFVHFLLFAFARDCGKEGRRMRTRSSRFDQLDADESMIGLLPASGMTPEQAVYSQEVGRQLEASLGVLSPDDRALIEQFYLEGRSIKEIADALGISEGAAKVRLHRARKRLAVAYRNHGFSLL